MIFLKCPQSREHCFYGQIMLYVVPLLCYKTGFSTHMGEIDQYQSKAEYIANNIPI